MLGWMAMGLALAAAPCPELPCVVGEMPGPEDMVLVEHEGERWLLVSSQDRQGEGAGGLFRVESETARVERLDSPPLEPHGLAVTLGGDELLVVDQSQEPHEVERFAIEWREGIPSLRHTGTVAAPKDWPVLNDLSVDEAGGVWTSANPARAAGEWAFVWGYLSGRKLGRLLYLPPGADESGWREVDRGDRPLRLARPNGVHVAEEGVLVNSARPLVRGRTELYAPQGEGEVERLARWKSPTVTDNFSPDGQGGVWIGGAAARRCEVLHLNPGEGGLAAAELERTARWSEWSMCSVALRDAEHFWVGRIMDPGLLVVTP